MENFRATDITEIWKKYLMQSPYSPKLKYNIVNIGQKIIIQQEKKLGIVSSAALQNCLNRCRKYRKLC